MGPTICIGREILCLPYAEFLFCVYTKSYLSDLEKYPKRQFIASVYAPNLVLPICACILYPVSCILNQTWKMYLKSLALLGGFFFGSGKFLV